MKRHLFYLLIGLVWAGGASAAERLWFDGQALELKAQARACYLGFLELYDVDYFRAPTRDTNCIRLSYLREFDAETLGEATLEVFKDRHGEGLVALRSRLRTFSRRPKPSASTRCPPTTCSQLRPSWACNASCGPPLRR